MSRDSDTEPSSTSSSYTPASSLEEEERHKRKKDVKKHKKKSDKKKHKKKDKKHKHKKKSRKTVSGPRSSDSEDDCPSQPKMAKVSTTREESVNSVPVPGGYASTYGPVLPPHLLKKNGWEESSPGPSLIGPTLPKEVERALQDKIEDEEEAVPENQTIEAEDDDEDSTAMFGPMPTQQGGAEMSEAQKELEQRALELKIQALSGGILPERNANEREEWMLELPEVGLKGGLAALSNMKRTFHQGKEKPDFSDRSSWTKTPQSEAAAASTSSKKSTQPTAEDLRHRAESMYEKQRDEEQERMAKKHKKKHKREESLVDMHQKKLKKEAKKKAKEMAEAGAKAERRPFSRDVDLKLNMIDRNQTKQIVDKAKILNTKFASGHTKYL